MTKRFEAIMVLQKASSLLTEHDGLIHFNEHPLDHRLRQSVTHRLEVHFQGKPGCAAPGSGREPTSIQNNSGLLRKIQVYPKDLPVRSVAG